jgi:ABC-type cobalamin/Fe3+-siderophores transport system ATPase subunit
MNILDIQDISVSINGTVIISDVNVTIKTGDFIFLKGSNGSGKSTLFNVLARYNPEGKYRINGKIICQDNLDILLIKEKDIHNYLRQIYYIQQETRDAGETVFQRFSNVMLDISAHKISENDVIGFFNECDVLNVFHGLRPEKLLHRKLSTFSEGQKKLIEILAGVMRAPFMKILLADEPLNHLDTGNIKKVIELFSNLRKTNPDLAIIMTTHCQAFPAPTKYLKIQSGILKESSVPYRHYDCFDEVDIT